jgi:iron(III) transport system permease protein
VTQPTTTAAPAAGGHVEVPDQRGPGRGRRRVDWAQVFQAKHLIMAAVVLTIAYLAIIPLGYLLWGTFWDGRSLTVEPFDRAYTATGLGELIWNSFWFAFGATLVSVVIGTGLAYLTERTDIPFKKLIFIASLVPLIIPGILYTISWIFLGSQRIGIFNEWLEPLFGPGTLNVFSLPGMIIVQGFDNAPLVFLLMVAAFRSMDPSLEESALMSGARMSRVFRRVTLPLVKPALFASILIMVVRNLEAFETPALLGMPSGIWVFTSRIWRVLHSFPIDYGQAGAYSLSLLVLTTVGIYLQSRFSRRSRQFQTVTGKGFRPRAMPLGKWRTPVTIAVLVYFFIAIVMPALVLVYMSTQPYYTVPSMETLTDLSWDNYEYIFNHSQTVRSFRNSFVLGITTATAVMFFTAIASWLVIRGRIPGRWMVDNLAFLPLVIPGLVLGVALIFIYLRFPIAIYGTLWILLIAYCTRYMPYGMRYASTSTYQIGGELEESAHVSGATWWQTFRRVNLPLLMPGLIAGWIYILMSSVRELSSSILLYSPGNEVLAIMIWEQYENGQFTELAALGVIMIAMLVVLVLIALRLGAKIGVQSR